MEDGGGGGGGGGVYADEGFGATWELGLGSGLGVGLGTLSPLPGGPVAVT